MQGTFRNANGTFRLQEHANVTTHNHQIPQHDVNFSSTLKQTATRYFDATVAQEFPPRMSQSNFMIAPQQKVAQISPTAPTIAQQPELATASRQRSIQERTIKKQEIKQAQRIQAFQPKHYTAEEIQNAEKLLAGGQIKVVKGIQKSIVKVENKAPVVDNYYHGGHVFDDYTGKH